MFRYVHTNIIAKDPEKLIDFYKKALHCKSIDETRDLSGEWLDKMTGIENAHITGEHLLLPGWGDDHPTLEIFSYDEVKDRLPEAINRHGLGHLAFEVDDVEESLEVIKQYGGKVYGELVTADYPGGVEAVFVYAMDPEGNIIELQSWKNLKSECKEIREANAIRETILEEQERQIEILAHENNDLRNTNEKLQKSNNKLNKLVLSQEKLIHVLLEDSSDEDD